MVERFGAWECPEWIELRMKSNCRKGGKQRELASRVDQRVLRWFGYVEKMDKYCMARRVLMTEVSGGRVRRRDLSVFEAGWRAMKVALGISRGMTREAGRRSSEDRKKLRALVQM